MDANHVALLIARIQDVEDTLCEDYPELPKPFIYRCEVKPSIQWNREALEKKLKITLPSELIQLWHHASGLRLHVDVNYGQWGLIIWSPDEVIARHPETIKPRPLEYREGDLVIGEYRGDPDFFAAILRS